MNIAGRSCRCFMAIAALAIAYGCCPVLAQQQSLPRPGTQASPGQVPNGADESEPEVMGKRILEQQAAKRNVLRQQQLVADTNKLVALAQQLKTEVDKSDKNTLSLNVLNKAEEIEKLARSVKDKMKAQ